MAEQHAPVDADADARIERERAEEKQILQSTCDELGVHIHEVRRFLDLEAFPHEPV